MTFTLTIDNFDNDAMTEVDQHWLSVEVKTHLQEALRVHGISLESSHIYDYNGNKVGTYKLDN